MDFMNFFGDATAGGKRVYRSVVPNSLERISALFKNECKCFPTRLALENPMDRIVIIEEKI